MQFEASITLRVRFLSCLLLVAGACITVSASAADAASAGRIKVEQVCSNCHGLDGQAASAGNSALSPTLTAQSKDYLVSRLKDYRTGKRQNPQMNFVAQMISEQDIENVAAWYAGLKIELSGNLDAADDDLQPGARAGKAKVEQLCQHCHGLDGQAVTGSTEIPIPDLSGQPRPYIVERLEAYRAGSIQQAQMTPIAKSLSDADIDNVADWYSGISVKVLDFNQ